MKQFFQQITKIWTELGTPQRMIVSAAALAVVAGIGALLFWAQSPDMKLLYGKLGEKEASEVVAVLEEKNIKFELRGGGTSIYVPANDVYRVRMDLAAKGLPNTDGVGFEIFDRSNFGISDFVQRTNYSRALQGELSRTVAQMKGVKSARVMVVMPESRLLVKTSDSRPTASVFVDTGSTKLDTQAVNSIRSLVASSVEGLKLDDVAVIDNAGNVLSEDLKSDPQLGSASSQVKYRQQTEDYLTSKVETMLAKVLGPGNAVVRVSATINTEASTTTEEKFDPEGQVPRQEVATEDTSSITEKGAEKNAGTGTAANVPDPNAGDADKGTSKSSNTVRSSKTQSYEINKTLTNVIKNPGAITRISAAVFLSQKLNTETNAPTPRTPEQLNELRNMVVNALGISIPKNETATNYVSIQEVVFPSAVNSLSTPVDKVTGYMEMARPIAALAIAAIVFAVFFFMLRRAKPEEISFELVDDATMAANAKALADAEDSQQFLPASKSLKVSPELLNSLIRQKPENVGATLREWLITKDES
jgi:flagellar M-ring protein FliF